MKKTKIYTIVDVKDNFPTEQNKDYIVSKDNLLSFEMLGNYTTGDMLYKNITHWLKEEEKYVFSKEELEKLIDDNYDIGKTIGYHIAIDKPISSRIPTREQYINNLFKE